MTGEPTTVNTRTWVTTGVISLGVVALCTALVSDGRVSSAEQSVFRAINELPDVLENPMVGVQYLGVAIVPFLVAAVALVLRRWRLAVAAVLVYPLKLVVEKVVLKELVYRGRPGTTEPDVMLRHVPAHGPSYPSGHAIVAFALAGILAPYLSRAWRVVAYAIALAVAFSRIYLGAHNPLDVLAGAASGMLIAAALNLVLLPHARPTRRADVDARVVADDTARPQSSMP
jgi:membrane-associated phospholipid phosphatase